MMSSIGHQNENLAQHLDGNVITLSMLGTIASARRSQNSVRSLLSEVEKKWCSLLDELSLLCDYKTGGKSVTSVAAQTTALGNVFWFASKQGTTFSIESQLRWILSQLQMVATCHETESQAIRRRLFKRCVAFNHRRVEFYWLQLHSLVQNAYQISTDMQKGHCSKPFPKQLLIHYF